MLCLATGSNREDGNKRVQGHRLHMSTIEPATWKKVESEPVKLVGLAASSGSAALLDGIKSHQQQKGNL